jgi:hypothetical protein
MCTVLLPPGDNPISVSKYIIYHTANDAEEIYIGKHLELIVAQVDIHRNKQEYYLLSH